MTVTLKNVDISLLDAIKQFVSSLHGVELETSAPPNALTEKVMQDCDKDIGMSVVYDNVEDALAELKR